MTDPLHTYSEHYKDKARRHEAWVKANWKRWANKGSYLEGARVDMDEVRAAWREYVREVYGDTSHRIDQPAPVRIMPPVRGLVDTHTEPDGALGYQYTVEHRTGVRVGEDWLQIAGISPQKPEPEALRVISLYHHTMTDFGRKAA